MLARLGQAPSPKFTAPWGAWSAVGHALEELGAQPTSCPRCRPRSRFVIATCGVSTGFPVLCSVWGLFSQRLAVSGALVPELAISRLVWCTTLHRRGCGRTLFR